METENEGTFRGPEPYALADWRRRVSELYEHVRRAPSPRAGWQTWRDTRDGLFRNHPMSPLPPGERETFAGLPYHDYDETLRFAVRLESLDRREPLAFELGADGTTRIRAAARTVGLAERLGGELTLYWIEGYGGGLFLPFGDGTNGTASYGGGRYLIDTIKGADPGLDDEGRLIVDFNFAYNPSCAYSPAFVCPLSPPENRLAVAVEAGERFG